MIKLNLGCGHKKIHSYINVDIDKKVSPDVVANIFDIPNVTCNSIDVIYASHVLEHFNREQALKCLKYWYTLLKDDGILRLAVPDLEAIFEYYICYRNLDELQNIIYGTQKNQHDFHLTGFDEKSLTKILSSIGFHNIYRYDWRLTEHSYVDDFSQAYLPKISYHSRRIEETIEGKHISLNLEAIK